MLNKKNIFFIFSLPLLFSVSLWAPHFQSLFGHGTFLTVDSMLILAGMLSLGLLGSLLVPDTVLTLSGRVSVFLRKSYWLWVVLIAAGVFAGAVAVNRHVLHSFMNSADEHSCLFLADCLSMGKWWVPTHPLQEFFNVVHVGSRDGKWFSVYPLGWPLLMALGRTKGLLDLLNPLITGLSVFFIFLFGKKLTGKTTVLAALLFTAITPFFLFTAASYYSHSTCLLMMSVFAFAFLKWKEAETERAQILWAAVGALAIGYGLLTRYLTMAAFAFPFLLYSIIPVFKRKRKLTKAEWVALGIILAFVLITMVQNAAVTGKPLKAPNKYDKSWERLGFRDDFTPLDASVHVLARFFYLMDWTPPVFLLLYLFFIWKFPEKDTVKRLFQFAFLYPVVAYFFYYSWGGGQYGPRYYYEGFPFLMLTLMQGIQKAWHENRKGVIKFCIIVLIAAFPASFYAFRKHAAFYAPISAERRALYDLAEQTIEEPAVVFIGNHLGKTLVITREDAVRNHPSLKQKIVYAHDRGPLNEQLKQYFPDRRFYWGGYDKEANKPVLRKL